mmetsp:Transcript_21141/g.39901  ORF Transcript_21141/g.39901 Transcript_21141/m.39901 type:complete len:312 (+) Transcript_21141:363-1298(+)
MCTAENYPSIFLNHSSSATATAKTRRPVRFAMKLPRYNAFASKNDSSASHQLQHHQAEEEKTPRFTNGATSATVAATTNGSNGPNMRRTQSVNGSRVRPRGIMAGMREHSMHKSRCQSQGRESSRRQLTQKTQELPIPASQATDRRRDSSCCVVRSVDKNDLTRMYDYATWNMYERIVSARRQRLQVDSQPDLTKEGANRSDDTTKALGFGTAKPQQQSLIKTSSHGDESTAGTADETDKSSTTSSSWSRNDSPMTFPSQQQTTTFLQAMHGGISGPVLPGLDREGCHSCPPPVRQKEINEDDSFIFQLDM